MATISALPLRSWIPPRVDNKDFRSFGKVEGDTSGFERYEEAFNVDVRHEVVDGGLTLSGCHGTIEHDCCDSCAAETPFDELKHGCELRKDDGFGGHVLGS